MRTYEIYYPETMTFDTVTVEVRPGETPEDAIMREGDAVSDWIISREVV